MDTNSHNSHPAMNPEVGYDHSDLSVRGIIIFLVGVGAAGVIAHLIIWGLFVGAKRVHALFGRTRIPWRPRKPCRRRRHCRTPDRRATVKFPEPRLQADDTADMSKFKNQEDMRPLSFAAVPERWHDPYQHQRRDEANRAAWVADAAGPSEATSRQQRQPSRRSQRLQRAGTSTAARSSIRDSGRGGERKPE